MFVLANLPTPDKVDPLWTNLLRPVPLAHFIVIPYRFSPSHLIPAPFGQEAPFREPQNGSISSTRQRWQKERQGVQYLFFSARIIGQWRWMQRVEPAFTFYNMTVQLLCAQVVIPTTNNRNLQRNIMRDKLQENFARITWPLRRFYQGPHAFYPTVYHPCKHRILSSFAFQSLSVTRRSPMPWDICHCNQ